MAISAKIMGKRLQDARLKKNYKQAYVAEQIGMTEQHLSRIENGAKTIYLDKLSNACDLLEVSIVRLLAEAETAEYSEYGAVFQEIVKDCSKETINDMLEMCSRMAEIERRARGEERK